MFISDAFDNYLTSQENGLKYIIMSNVKFILRNKHSKNKTMILLTFSYQKQRLRMTTGLSVRPKDWNFKKQCIVERNGDVSASDKNLHLRSLAARVGECINQSIARGIIPPPAQLKAMILNSEERSSSFFWETFDAFIQTKRKEIVDITAYDRALRKHLLATEVKMGHHISFEDFSRRRSPFLENFQAYLSHDALNTHRKKGLSQNTIGKQYKCLKVFLGWCFGEELVKPFNISHLKIVTEEVDTVYLTAEELQQLEDMTLAGHVALVRDLFLVGCETGMRFSDFCRFGSVEPSADFVEYFAKKTSHGGKGFKVRVPISMRLRNILKKYHYALPVYPSSNLGIFNKTIRYLCHEAGMNEHILTHKIHMGQAHSFHNQKWQLVSSHTCRRTFCTLKFLSGMPAQAIMRFSGHKTERNFMRYLRLDAELSAEEYRSFF
jgi:integrase